MADFANYVSHHLMIFFLTWLHRPSHLYLCHILHFILDFFSTWRHFSSWSSLDSLSWHCFPLAFTSHGFTGCRHYLSYYNCRIIIGFKSSFALVFPSPGLNEMCWCCRWHRERMLVKKNRGRIHGWGEVILNPSWDLSWVEVILNSRWCTSAFHCELGFEIAFHHELGFIHWRRKWRRARRKKT